MSSANMRGEKSGRLGIGIIGAGRVGPVLGAALAHAGHAIIGISAISEEGRERAEAILPGVPLLSVGEIVERSELVILAIPSSEIESLVGGLTTLGAWQPGQLVMHTAPEFGTGVFSAALARGVIPLALHPAISFTGTTLDLARLAEGYCVVTAPAPVLPIAQALAVEMGAEPIVVAEGDRPAYASALDSATAMATTVVRKSLEELSAIGIQHPGNLLGTALHAAVDRAVRSDPNAMGAP
ncbi:DUF2520 domain-containing protein [Lysinibacter sp. HNR]|uniref:DUF2520 domain-containing protein n=1 Tax=Lysinibacter sp. HNR TaxID=3031408 RepID=UPI0024359FFC|nr:DUF2520 domain-containing protein [Lysinibacter sp. HNR]WGD36808.1 DUF2520 domain-containing protein [Lysinibacter sp. HNR]